MELAPFKSLCLVGVLGMVGFVGVVGAIGARRITDIIWFRHAQNRVYIGGHDPEQVVAPATTSNSPMRLVQEGHETQETKRLLTKLKEKDERIRQLESEVAELKETPKKSDLQLTIVNKTDSISVAEVADLVKVLNARIEQTSSLLTDSLVDRESSSTGKELEIAWDELKDYIGSWLCDVLQQRSKELTVEPDPLITQITLQTGLINACSCIINDRDPPFWIDRLISRTCSSIEKANGQAIADAWKSLSKSNIPIFPQDRQEANMRYLTEVLLKLITAVGGPLEIGEALSSQYKEKMEDIARNVVGLHKSINEDITSMELVTFTISSGTPFDSFQMEDTEGGEGGTQSSEVVCAVEMGLRARKRIESGKKNGSNEGWGVTMKSKVVLAATLEA